MHEMTTSTRRQRRALKATSRRQKPDQVVAVHEAGHCLGRVLTAAALGWQPQQAIYYIDIFPAGQEPLMLGFLQHGRSQGTTWGPFFSKPMQDFFSKWMLEKSRPVVHASTGPVDPSELKSMVAEMRGAGIDVDRWLRANALRAICGPMAESRLIGKKFDAVWGDDSSILDFNGAVHAGWLVGLGFDAIASVIEEMIDVAKSLFTRPDVWHAIMSLSANLKFGRNSGREAANIIVRHLKKGAEFHVERPLTPVAHCAAF